MQVKVGCEFAHKASGPTPAIWQVRPRPDGPAGLLTSVWETAPRLPTTTYVDAFGNLCDRLVLPEGNSVVRYDALAEVSDLPDPVDLSASQTPIECLPNDALVYLLPTRFCLSDVLHDEAWDLFGGVPAGWARVQAVSDWVHANVTFDYMATSPVTTACDVWKGRTGVCRDFAHLGVTFCRALNMPARYVFGYLPDIDVAPAEHPMDFCAWMEVYLGDRWWTFDPRNNQRRLGRVLIGRGRDAVDVAMLTTYGATILESMTVWANKV